MPAVNLVKCDSHVIEQAGRASLARQLRGDACCPLGGYRAVLRALLVAARGPGHPWLEPCQDAAWAACRSQESGRA
jgi:hypothetical protein